MKPSLRDFVSEPDLLSAASHPGARSNNVNKKNLDECKEEKCKDDNYIMKQSKRTPYHEEQHLEMCLVHALNGLYQKRRFTSDGLDKICDDLAPDAWINPHKSILQTGNYDANVLMMALSRDGIDVQWFDSRKASAELRLSETFLCPNGYSEFKGFILNNPHKKMIVFSRRHWIAITRIDGVWYNLDSRYKKPQKYETKEEITRLERWLIHACVTNDAQLLICRVKKQPQKETQKVLNV